MYIACPGVGHVARGFESFSRECFEALRDRPELRAFLIKGHGPSGERELSVPTLRRETGAGRMAGRLFRCEPYEVEQVVFALALSPLTAARRPDVILFSDLRLGQALMRIRNATRQRYKLLLSNSAPLGPPYDYADHVQQVTQPGFEYVLWAGERPDRHTMLPLGLRTDGALEVPSASERAALRRRLGLPEDAKLLLSVAALNKWHKRLDYVIGEVAAVSAADRPHLVLLGQREEETPEVLALAQRLLGAGGFTARTVQHAEVPDYYRAADAFVLASTFEGMGRAYLEALSYGLPALAHDHPVARFVLGGHGLFADLREPGSLHRLLRALGERELTPERRRERHRYVYENFSWDVLTPRYVELLLRVAGS